VLELHVGIIGQMTSAAHGAAESRRLRDSYGRVADDLRISVTDRCNFRCVYCMPAEGVRWLAREDILRFEEIHRLARLFIERYGVRTVRLTGGEPLVRTRIEELVAMIDRLDPNLDITMTTNGVLLRQKARLLKEAGLKRINVSLDTLHIDRFQEIARREAFDRVLDGLKAAEEAGLSPIKLNVVVMRGVNDDEVVDFARLAREKGYLVRFIEFMPLDGDGGWSNDKVLPSRRIQERIEDEFPLVPESDDRPGPSVNYRFDDGAPGGVGFISSVSQAFCATCNRVRLTAEGGLRTCLFSLSETPLRDLMREGASDDRLCEVIESAIWRKEEGHLINQEGFVKPVKYMSQIGG
jgi:cyclic pyranopterin phosphate synthase